ncbi:hypothetical protein BKA63DRAFT_27113 [Paraphoma chrysanthemicola]|nr:hypothetical protein BKA63DRAFT_27113 [Paraphoma chrysanthemicola]
MLRTFRGSSRRSHCSISTVKGNKLIVRLFCRPERGSFPLDHDGECKDIMLSYLRCIKSHRGSNDPECRNLSKSYLSCRMDRYVPSHPFVILSQPHIPRSAVGRCTTRKGRRGSCATKLSDLLNRVVGSPCLGAAGACKGEVLAPFSLAFLQI